MTDSGEATAPLSLEDFETQVNDTIKAATRDGAGKLVFPEDAPVEVAYAARAEIRRRHTQGEYTKAEQSNAALKAENDELIKRYQDSMPLDVSPEKQKALDEMKFADPEKWYEEMRKLEGAQKKAQSEELKKQLAEVSAEGTKAAELKHREAVFNEFNKRNDGPDITVEMLQANVPPRLFTELEKGELTFEEFLDKAHNYLGESKVVADGEQTSGQTNLGKVDGGSEAETAAKGTSDNYTDVIY